MKYAVKIDFGGLTGARQQNVREFVQRGLREIGEKAVNEARLNHGYTDQTGNLTASIGYALADGEGALDEGGFTSPPGKVAPEGEDTGRALAEARATRDGQTRLTVVAGMEYASYVEKGHTARNGRYVEPRAVLANAELLIRDEVNKLQQDFKNATLS